MKAMNSMSKTINYYYYYYMMYVSLILTVGWLVEYGGSNNYRADINFHKYGSIVFWAISSP